jgi:hypothetical protein
MGFPSFFSRGEFLVDDLMAIKPQQQNLDEFCDCLVETWVGIAQSVYGLDSPGIESQWG